MDLPPAVPEVSFDRKLGATFGNIEFDYHEFYELAHEAGVSDDAISDFKLFYSAEQTSKWSEFLSRPPIYGKYRSRRKSATILPLSIVHAVAQEAHEDDTSFDTHASQLLNETVIHETAHRFQAMTLSQRMSDRMYVAGLYAFGALTASAVAESFVKESPLPAIAAFSLDGVAFYFAAERYKDPRNLPHEKFAYEFQATHAGRYAVSHCTTITTTR